MLSDRYSSAFVVTCTLSLDVNLPLRSPRAASHQRGASPIAAPPVGPRTALLEVWCDRASRLAARTAKHPSPHFKECSEGLPAVGHQSQTAARTTAPEARTESHAWAWDSVVCRASKLRPPASGPRWLPRYLDGGSTSPLALASAGVSGSLETGSALASAPPMPYVGRAASYWIWRASLVTSACFTLA